MQLGFHPAYLWLALVLSFIYFLAYMIPFLRQKLAKRRERLEEEAKLHAWKNLSEALPQPLQLKGSPLDYDHG